MRCVKKNKSKIPKIRTNKISADAGVFDEKRSSTGPPVSSPVKLTGEYTPKRTSAISKTKKMPR